MQARERYVLGLDLGANSLGWAALRLDENGKPCGLMRDPSVNGSDPSIGVRVFEMAVDDFGKGENEQPKNANRRAARLQRRQAQRRARRITKTFNLLQRNGLLQAFDEVEAAMTDRRAARDHLIKRLDIQLSANYHPERLPYALRACALDSALEKHALGRALYHLSQRRGFKSNRKSEPKKGDDQGVVKEGIADLERQMAVIDAATGRPYARTLGELFFKMSQAGNRVRRHWTARKMYEDEFDAIVAAQEPHHAELQTEKFVRHLRRAIFYQRPLKSSRHLIGTCELENGEE